MKGTISTPNIGFKKLLLKRFEIFEINEYNTSKLYNKTFKEQLLTKSKVIKEKSMIFLELENVSVRKNKHKKHLHEILTPKEKTERCIFVNRDKNACKNILYLGKYFLEHQLRHFLFSKKKENAEMKKYISSSLPKEFSPKPKENNVIIKQRKTKQKKEIVI
jgi:hypothetical protein